MISHASTLPIISSFGQQRLLERRGVPYAAGDEKMKLIVSDVAVARRLGLHALAIPCANQSRNVDWTHPRLRLVAKGAQKRRQPLLLSRIAVSRIPKTPDLSINLPK
jgi:hypothetical protein